MSAPPPPRAGERRPHSAARAGHLADGRRHRRAGGADRGRGGLPAGRHVGELRERARRRPGAARLASREELFVTTKFNKQWHSVDGARRACEASLERLGLDYLDLLLVHWPNPAQDRYVDAFRGLLELRRDGLLPLRSARRTSPRRTCNE